MSVSIRPEIHDLVSVTHKGCDYYGYIYDIDWDMRSPAIKVEFWPGESSWFEFSEVTLVEFPEKRK